MKRVTIDLPDHPDTGYTIVYCLQPDGTTVQVTAKHIGGYEITTDYETLTRCDICHKHQKVGACTSDCPFCLAGDLCTCGCACARGDGCTGGCPICEGKGGICKMCNGVVPVNDTCCPECGSMTGCGGCGEPCPKCGCWCGGCRAADFNCACCG